MRSHGRRQQLSSCRNSQTSCSGNGQVATQDALRMQHPPENHRMGIRSHLTNVITTMCSCGYRGHARNTPPSTPPPSHATFGARWLSLRRSASKFVSKESVPATKWSKLRKWRVLRRPAVHWETKNRQRRQHCRKFSGRRHKNIQGVSNSSNVRKDVVAKFEEENARHNANSFVFNVWRVRSIGDARSRAEVTALRGWAERDAPHGCADKFRQTPWCKSTDRDCPRCGLRGSREGYKGTGGTCCGRSCGSCMLWNWIWQGRRHVPQHF